MWVVWTLGALFESAFAADLKVIDYFAAVQGGLQIVPDDAARDALAAGYAKMLEDQVMASNALPFTMNS